MFHIRKIFSIPPTVFCWSTLVQRNRQFSPLTVPTAFLFLPPVAASPPPTPAPVKWGATRLGFPSFPAMASSTATSLFSAPVRPAPPVRATSASPGPRSVSAAGFSRSGYGITGVRSVEYPGMNPTRTIVKAFAVATTTGGETKECILPTWAEFDIGKAPVFWKTMNGYPPTSGEMLTLFYNPAAGNLVPNDDFGVAFNGGFNQPLMCGGEPRTMTKKKRGKADPPIYSIKIRVPVHAINIIFSFTNGVDWDGPYKLQLQVLKKWRNKPISFFNEGLAEELSKEGACDAAIFPDSQVMVNRCSITNLSAEGHDRCNLDLVAGCMDPGSHLFNPLATVDDGSCPIDV